MREELKLIIFGPPGSGKGTYSARLKDQFGLEKIATGDIFREQIKNQTEMGKQIENILKEGKLVPDDVVIKVVKSKLKGLDNFILDGFPRTIEQAKALQKIVKINAIIMINAHPEVLIEKISGRRICSNSKCDGNYNVADIQKTINNIEYTLPPLLPKDDMKCDKCNSPLIQRDDDTPRVINERLRVYEQQSQPVLEFYKKQKKIPIVEVWMNRPPQVVVNTIVEKLKSTLLTVPR